MASNRITIAVERAIVADNAELRKRVEELEAALRWYADKSNWVGMAAPAPNDCGARAKIALKGRNDGQ